jgi:hypothetical protein
MIKTQTTGLIGLLFDDKYDITKIIRKIVDEIQKNFTFVPQCYLHTTLIYLGKEYKDDYNLMLDNMNFACNINKLKGVKCIFSHIEFIGNSLIYVYRFEDINNEFIISDLINIYEKYPHSPNFHITIGQFYNNYDKIKFFKIKKYIDKMLENTYFYLDQIEIIEVDIDKKYNLYQIIT